MPDRVLALETGHFATLGRAMAERLGLEVDWVPDGVDADDVRRIILARFDLSLGAGLGKLAGRVFRIGHLGDFNDLMLAGTLCGGEMGLRLTGVPVGLGVEAALDRLALAQPVAV